ncbi:unnamed protein product [Dicrocoelium dendriticum]|nr:unnamed protein product [Dicrocoelium dendriticum]
MSNGFIKLPHPEEATKFTGFDGWNSGLFNLASALIRMFARVTFNPLCRDSITHCTNLSSSARNMVVTPRAALLPRGISDNSDLFRHFPTCISFIVKWRAAI